MEYGSLVPIARVLEGKRVVKYVLYNPKTKENFYMKFREIKEAIKAGIKIIGLAGRNSSNLCSLRLNSYFKNIGSAGEKKNGKQYYTISLIKVYSEAKRFMIVDCVGKDFELEESDLIKLFQNGAVIAGGKLTKNNVLRVSSEIEIVFMK